MPQPSQAEVEQLIVSLIIDNNIMAIDPYKMRQVLTAINARTQNTDLASVSAQLPLVYDSFTNVLRFKPILYGTRRIKAKGEVGIMPFTLEEGDIVEGWSPDGKSWWDSAIFNGGPEDEDTSYLVIVGSQVIV